MNLYYVAAKQQVLRWFSGSAQQFDSVPADNAVVATRHGSCRDEGHEKGHETRDGKYVQLSLFSDQVPPSIFNER